MQGITCACTLSKDSEGKKCAVWIARLLSLERHIYRHTQYHGVICHWGQAGAAVALCVTPRGDGFSGAAGSELHLPCLSVGPFRSGEHNLNLCTAKQKSWGRSAMVWRKSTSFPPLCRLEETFLMQGKCWVMILKQRLAVCFYQQRKGKFGSLIFKSPFSCLNQWTKSGFVLHPCLALGAGFFYDYFCFSSTVNTAVSEHWEHCQKASS